MEFKDGWEQWAHAKRRNKMRTNRYYAEKQGAQIVEDVYDDVVLEQSKGICGLCDKPITGKFQMDHKIPILRGGTHTYDNIHATHPECNYAKGSMTYEEYRSLVQPTKR